MKAIASRGVIEAVWSRPSHALAASSSGSFGKSTLAANPLPQRPGSVSIAAACSALVASPQGQSSVTSSLTSAPTSRSAFVRSG